MRWVNLFDTHYVEGQTLEMGNNFLTKYRSYETITVQLNLYKMVKQLQHDLIDKMQTQLHYNYNSTQLVYLYIKATGPKYIAKLNT